MTYETLDSRNASEGLHVLFIYVADIVPIFIPLVLFALFVITLLGTFFSHKRLTNRSDFPASFAVAGYLTMVVAFVMNLIPNLINNYTLVVCLVVAVIGTLWLLLSRQG